MKDLKLLIELQKIDDLKKDLKKKLDENINLRKVELYKKELKKRKEELKENKDKIGMLQHKIKEKEFEDARLTRQEDDYKEQLYNGNNTSPKELQKLQEKLARTEENKKELEEDLLQLMMELEDRNEELEEVKEEIVDKKNNLNNLQEGFIKKKESLRGRLDEIDNKKEQLQEKIDNDLVVKYNELYKKRNGKAVAELKNDCCLGCRMSLPLNIIRKVKRNEELTFCEHCGRILYYQG